MKFIIFFVTIFFCLMSTAQTENKIEIKGKINNLQKANNIFLLSIKGTKRNLVDSAKIQNKEFVFSIDSLLPTGVYEIFWTEKHSIPIIVANEPKIQIEIDESNPNLSPKSIVSEENKIYFTFLNFQNKIDSISKIGNDLYSKGEYSQLSSLQKQLKEYSSAALRAADSISLKHPNSFALKIFRSSVPPDFNEYKRTNPNTEYANELQFLKRHFFDNIDKTDSNLLNSSVIHDACSFYLRNITEEKTFEGFKKSSDFILSTFSRNNQQFDYVLDLLLSTFESAEMETLYIYLVDTYMQTETCEGGTPNNQERKADSFRNFKIGDQVPELSAQNRNGEIVNLSDYHGKPILLMFWASYCSHCEESMPEIRRILEKYKDTDLVFFSFSIDESINNWLKALYYNKIPEPSICDFAGYDGQNAIKWCIWGTPTFFVIGKDGKIVSKPMNTKQLEEGISKAL